MVDVTERASSSVPTPVGDPARRELHSVTDIRSLVPPLGLKEYWYPAVQERKVKKKPVGVKMLGEDLVFFRDKSGEVRALWNVCPHRGGSLMHGDCHYTGTISCPYHGWTFDGDGNVLAVLPEGPESKVPGKVKARSYPTRTLKGVVFVWMGESEPVPIEEDVPPEFFDDHTMILTDIEYWPVQWNVALENGGDAHVPYVHRNSVRQLMGPVRFVGPTGARNRITDGKAVTHSGYGTNAASRSQYYFPALEGYWPKHTWRRLWTWLFFLNSRPIPAWECPEEWRSGHHLPGMYRGVQRNHLYSRASVPVTENISRQFYLKAVRPKNWFGRVYERLHFVLWYKWTMFDNFSKQDFRAVAPQRYDTPEHLSATDSHQILWRRLLLQARGMKVEDAQRIEETDAEKFGFRVQEELGVEPSRINGQL